MDSKAEIIVSKPYDAAIHDKHVLTNWYLPEHKAPSGWSGGEDMTHAEWLQSEVKAFKKKGRSAIIIHNTKGQLALAEMERETK